MKPTRLSRTVKHESRWLDLYLDRVQMPTGTILEQYHCIHSHVHGVAALVVDDAGRILMIQSYRYVVDSIEWEIPAGGREGEESVLETARREVLEETGYESTDHEMIYVFNPLISICDQIHHIVRCRAGEKVAEFDPNEVKETRWFTPEEVRDMIRGKALKDGYTLVALLLHLGGLP